MTSFILVKNSRNLLPASAGVAASCSENVITTLVAGRNPQLPLGNLKYL